MGFNLVLDEVAFPAGISTLHFGHLFQTIRRMTVQCMVILSVLPLQTSQILNQHPELQMRNIPEINPNKVHLVFHVSPTEPQNL